MKKVKVDLDDEPVIISTSTSSSTDAKRAPAAQQQRYATSAYNRSQANLAALARATKFPCTKCGNKFETKTDLDKHDSTEHDEGR